MLRAALALLLLAEAAAPPPLRVLFIGNSLTAANDLPALVESLGKANGRPIVTRMVAFPNYSLEDHWQRGDAQRAIAQGGWSFVVFQQGPSALEESRVNLLEFARRFAHETQRVHARTAFYMVWPAASRGFDFDGVRVSYQTAARETRGVFLPAGEAWRLAWHRDPGLALYGSDGFHPTPLGSYLAAVVVYQGLTGQAPARLPAGWVSGAQAKVLQEAASEALGR